MNPPPADEPWDALLRQRVGPPEEPVPLRESYDVVVLGGGTAGLVASATAAFLGASVALFERDLLGGDCLVSGCVPSKALLHAAAQRMAFAPALTKTREVRAAIAVDDSVDAFTERGVEVHFGEASFENARTLRVVGRRGEQKVGFGRAIIATGGRPRGLELPGLDPAVVITHETLFESRDPPASLIVLGGGPMGCELSQAMAGLGVDVTLVSRSPRLLPADDPDASALVHDALETAGVRVLLDVEPVRAEVIGERTRLHLRSRSSDEEGTAEGSQVLLAVGREPRVEALNLDAAGVRHEAGRGILVDEQQRTTVRSIFAAGDVSSAQKFTHAAYAQAEAAAVNALTPRKKRVPSHHMPHVTFTAPEVAHVGPAFAMLTARDDLEVFTLLQSVSDRGRVEDETVGFARVYVRKGTTELVAGTVVGAFAGEQIALLCFCLAAGGSLETLRSTILPYPTRADLMRQLAEKVVLSRWEGSKGKAVRSVLKWFR